jgi:uncharacterized damage-inducible protein DinB
MDSVVFQSLVQRLHMVNSNLLKVTQDLADEQLCKRPGLTAPPIGWHLWHISRWADRFQASFPKRGDNYSGEPSNPNRDLWHIENLAAQWDLSPTTLGVLETGAGMEHDVAASIPKIIGKENLLNYGRRVFSASEQALGGLNLAELDDPRTSIMEYEIIGSSIREAPGKETTHMADIMFHITHANRHLGMIEALRGLLDMNGTATA